MNEAVLKSNKMLNKRQERFVKGIQEELVKNKEFTVNLINSQYCALEVKQDLKDDFIDFDAEVESYRAHLFFATARFSGDYAQFIKCMEKSNFRLASLFQSMRARNENLRKLDDKIKKEQVFFVKSSKELLNKKGFGYVENKTAYAIYYQEILNVLGKNDAIFMEGIDSVFEDFKSREQTFIECKNTFANTANAIKETTQTIIAEAVCACR